MADSPFLGMRGADDFLSSEGIENWRQGILRMYPNGMFPLTALSGLMTSEETTEYQYNWHTKGLPSQEATITGRYTDILSTAYTSGATAFSTMYIKMAEADTVQFRPGHQVLLRYSEDPLVDVNAKVISITRNGASSFLTVMLLEADDNSTANNLSKADICLVIGNINPDGGTRPSSIVYKPQSCYNYTQIFRNSLELTRRGMKKNLRTGNPYQEAKADALELHALEMEKAFIWGIRSKRTGDNGKEETTTAGLVSSIKTYAPDNVFNYITDEDYAGATWKQKGQFFINKCLEVIFRYGDVGSRLVFAGSGALMALNNLASELGIYQISESTTKFGITLTEWQTALGQINIKTHPLFSRSETDRYTMIVFVPEQIKFKYIDDTFFYPDGTYKKGGGTGKDGISEEWLTDAGIENHFPEVGGIMYGVGKDNTVE